MPHEQLILIKKTDEELEESITKKRAQYGLNVQLDPEEEALLIRQMHEDQNDRDSTYPH